MIGPQVGGGESMSECFFAQFKSLPIFARGKKVGSRVPQCRILPARVPQFHILPSKKIIYCDGVESATRSRLTSTSRSGRKSRSRESEGRGWRTGVGGPEPEVLFGGSLILLGGFR